MKVRFLNIFFHGQTNRVNSNIFEVQTNVPSRKNIPFKTYVIKQQLRTFLKNIFVFYF